MAQQSHPGQAPARQRPRRWPYVALAAMVLLVAYGSAVFWFSTRIGDDIQARMPEVPVAEDIHHRAD